MTKAPRIDEVSRVSNLTKKHAEVIVNTVFESIITSLKEGEKIELRGSGSFRLRERGSRTGRNPKTGEKVQVPPKRIPYFKPGKGSRRTSSTRRARPKPSRRGPRLAEPADA